jgi:regulator of replication initiation timing
MKEKIVTTETVAEARDELLAEHEAASIRNIRKKLGGGSLSTIHAKLKQLQTLKPEIPLNTQERLKPLLQAGAELLMKTSEDISCALRAENKCLLDDMDALAQSLQDTEASLEDLKTAHMALQESNSALKYNYDRTREELEKKEAELNSAKEELIKARLNLEGYQEVREEAKEARDRAAKLEGRLEVYEGKNDNFQAISPKKEGIRLRPKRAAEELG